MKIKSTFKFTAVIAISLSLLSNNSCNSVAEENDTNILAKNTCNKSYSIIQNLGNDNTWLSAFFNNQENHLIQESIVFDQGTDVRDYNFSSIWRIRYNNNNPRYIFIYEGFSTSKFRVFSCDGENELSHESYPNYIINFIDAFTLAEMDDNITETEYNNLENLTENYWVFK